MHKFVVSILSAGIVFASFFAAAPVHAASLYFEKVPVKTKSETTCLHFAGDTLRSQGYASVHSNSLEAAGSKQGAYVSITCVGRGAQPAMAIAMVAGSDFAVAKQLGHAAADHVKAIICFDSPC